MDGQCSLLLYFVCLFTLQLSWADTEREEYRAPCRFDSDCIENAYCVLQQHCSCKPGYVAELFNGTRWCLKNATGLGDPCTRDIQCRITFGAHATCLTNGTCGCNETAHFIENFCFQSVFIGSTCRLQDECRTNPTTFRAECVRSVCTCPSSYLPSQDRRYCYPRISIGDICSTHTECIIMNSTCSGGVCRCQSGFVSSINNTACLRYATQLGESCEDDVQCSESLPNSRCINKICSCPTGYHQVSQDGWCWESKGLGDICTNSRECVLERTTSNDVILCSQAGVCECAPGYYPNALNTDCTGGTEPLKFTLWAVLTLLLTCLL